MKKLLLAVAALVLAGSLDATLLPAGTLETVKEKGVLVAGVKDTAPPFGFTDPKTGHIVGYDVDLVQALADRLGVKLRLVPVTTANRIPLLIDGEIDIIAATMSKTRYRSHLVDFTDTYFTTGQQFLARAGTVKSLKDLEGKRIAVVKGATAEPALRKALPSAKTVLFDNYLQAAMALKRNSVDAVTADGAILYGVLAMARARSDYDIPDIRISDEEYALGVRKRDRAFLDAVNAAMRDLEKSGEQARIRDKWLAFVKAGSAPSPLPPATSRAGGVVFRSTATPFRFLVMAIKGEFRTGGDVAIYDTQGSFIAKGTVRSIYSDEVYVDVDEEKAQFVEPGYAVAMNIPPEEAKKIILARQDILKSVKDEAKKEAAQRQKEIAAEHQRETVEREAYQEEMTKLKMQYDYQYDHDRYYYYSPGWGGYPAW